MHADDSRAALEEELRQLEADLAELRRTAAEVRREIGQQLDGATDAADRSALITEAEEQEALAEDLDVRRDKLRHKLGLE